MLLASGDLLDHVSDHPWPGWQVELWGTRITLMSDGIATMILVAAVLCAVLIPICQRNNGRAKGAAGVVEVIVLFVRDMIARPALHDRADEYMPYLLTLFVYVLGLDMVGMVPLKPVTNAVPIVPSVGGTPTAILTVCAALALTTLLAILYLGFRRQALHAHRRKHWPMPLCIALAPILWLWSLSPPIPGVVGVVLLVPMVILELIGVAAKCFSLMVRLFANMMAGHVLLAVLMTFILQAIGTWALPLVGPLAVAGSVIISCIELLVAFLQAYIFTFLSAMFLGLYAEAQH